MSGSRQAKREPTGNLDAQSATEVMMMLQKRNKDFGKTMIMVTHHRHAAEYTTAIRHLEKGKLKPEIVSLCSAT